MTITVKKIALSELESQVEEYPLFNENYLGIIGALEVECQVHLGTVITTIAELRQLKQGQILSLGQNADEPIDILLNSQIIARGELMSAEDHFAILITEVLTG